MAYALSGSQRPSAAESGDSPMFLYIVGDLLIIARIPHAVGLKHNYMAHKGRLIGAGGTALITLVTAGYGL